MNKERIVIQSSSVGVTVKKVNRGACLLALALIGLGVLPARAQVPTILWRTNVSAKFLSEDAQTNVYLNSGSTIITLNSSGVPVQTNAINQPTSVAQRDASGNYYFAGQRPGQNLGSYLDYGTTNACFLTKYTPGGTLVWSNGFGPAGQIANLALTDVQVDTNGNAYVGYAYNILNSQPYSTMVAKLDDTGASLWNVSVPTGTSSPGQGPSAVHLTVLSPTNGLVLTYANTVSSVSPIYLSSFDNNGTATIITNWTSDYWGLSPALERDSAGNFYTRESGYITKRDPSAALIWRFALGSMGPVGVDPSGGVYVSDLGANVNTFSRYDAYGNLVWTTNYYHPPIPYWSHPVSQVFVDPSGNRFISFGDGSIARMMADSVAAKPSITTPPQSTTAFVGDNVSFGVTVSGTQPFFYTWQCAGTNIPNATSATLSLNSVATSQAGSYSVIVSNTLGVVTSTPPAVLRVKQVELYLGSQLLTNGTYSFATPPTLTIRSAFTNGEAFYTLNGSAPNFSSTTYSGPFAVSSNATVRAIGYSADFSQSEEADQVNISFPPSYTLTTTTAGGGTIALSPTGGVYLSSTLVTVSAIANAGWQFLYWLGDATGSSSPAQVTMNTNKTVTAVFATTLSTTVAGNGQVLLDPPGGLYPYGTTVRLTGVPQPGNYFGAWGNAASGSVNPLYFTVTNPTPTVSSIFGATSGQVALTVEISGHGHVNVSPSGNVFSSGQMVTLTAVPDSGQSFLCWGGNASGSQTPLNVTLNQSEVITASFTGAAALRVGKQFGEGMGPGGFQFGLLSDPGSIYPILCSTNFASWTSLGYVTNQSGTAEVLDSAASNSPQRFYRIAP
jgi:hypothetical protein